MFRKYPPFTVSVVATVLNEAGNVAALIDSLAAQTHQPDEVVIVDGGSTDGTPERAREAAAGRLKLVVVPLPGANISEGRNAAIARASGEVIAVTDAGVRLRADWLEQLLAPFERRRGQIDVVSGFFEADPSNVFELAMGATVLPSREEINPVRFLPSSRSVAFTREAWKRVGGYPEWLDYCEDLVFDMALRDAGLVFAWAPGATVLFRPRGDLRSFWHQYYRYARGDGKAGLFARRHLVRYGSYLAGASLMLASPKRRSALLPLLLGATLHLWAPYRRLAPRLGNLAPAEKVEAIAWVPVIRLVGDLAKMAGYPAGLLWRLGRK